MSTFVFPSLCTNNHTRKSEILMHFLVYWFARKIQKLHILQFHTIIQNGYMQKELLKPSFTCTKSTMETPAQWILFAQSLTLS